MEGGREGGSMGNRVFNLMGLSRFKSEIWGKLLEISKNRDI